MTVYLGWKVFAHLGPVVHKVPDLKRKFKQWFDHHPKWRFEDNDRTFIYHQNIDSPIEVFFGYETTGEEKAMGLDRYGLVLNSDFFPYRNDYYHQQVCYEVLHKIPWRKQAYFVTDDEWIPIPKKRILRKKRR